MDMERELRDLLYVGLRDNLPWSRREKRKRIILNKMVKCILPLLMPSEVQHFSQVPDYLHLRTMIILYEKWNLLTNTCYNDLDCILEQKILSYLLKVCYYWWIQDFNILVRIIRHYYKSHQSYFEILDGEIDNDEKWDSLFSYGRWLTPARCKTNRSSNNSPLAYFLMCYNYGSFIISGRAFANEICLQTEGYVTLCSICFRLSNPKQLLLLLQYGGTFSATDCAELEAEACFQLIDETLQPLWMDFEAISSMLPHLIPIIVTNQYWQKKLLCIRLMLRVMPQVKMQTKLDRSSKIVIISRLLTTYHPGFFPDITQRLTVPCQLKHLCRLRIRSTDMVSTMLFPYLPKGIENLNLPQCLINYLNLLDD